MKVLALCGRAYIGVTDSGGAERMIHSMMVYLNQCGWKTSAIVLQPEGPDVIEQNVDGVDVIIPKDKHHLHRVFAEADLVITHLAGTYRAVIMGKNYGVPVVQLIHNTSEYTVGFLGESCDYAIYNSRWVQGFHRQAGSSPLIQSWSDEGAIFLRDRRCFEWPSMVLRPPAFPVAPSGDPNGYITLMNLVPNKGPETFYKIAKQNPHLKFLAVKGGYQASEQVIEDLPNVTVVSHSRDPEHIYAQSSIVLMPSKYESYGLVAVEAISRGIPVIATPGEGLREALGKGTFRDRDDIRGWSDDIHMILNDYDVFRRVSIKRAEELQLQTIQELAEFESEMSRLVKTWDSSR